MFDCVRLCLTVLDCVRLFPKLRRINYNLIIMIVMTSAKWNILSDNETMSMVKCDAIWAYSLKTQPADVSSWIETPESKKLSILLGKNSWWSTRLVAGVEVKKTCYGKICGMRDILNQLTYVGIISSLTVLTIIICIFVFWYEDFDIFHRMASLPTMTVSYVFKVKYYFIMLISQKLWELN